MTFELNEQILLLKMILPMACRWRLSLFSSSELCEEDDGSTSETPESAGLGGNEPAEIFISDPPPRVEIRELFTIGVMPTAWMWLSCECLRSDRADGSRVRGVASPRGNGDGQLIPHFVAGVHVPTGDLLSIFMADGRIDDVN